MEKQPLQYVYGNTQDPPAFPIFDTDGTSVFAGLSKKEYIAIQIFASIMPSFRTKESDLIDKAHLAVKAAEVLTKELVGD